ncbi:hypothetical protein PSQ40_14355 [Curvibacter sp. HBC61]|uniref:Uncharacterized protein n=1 Tax=Curvibacter cyanobacteriorum TaxID=3026422 RepID=A0ABT5N0B9_9BURK|nr:exosortase H-associated membrane protein [Curvibacter sp. HBC61]MDD0839764.1 hypothetical protein [Curvibacter sp. HBC61]
MKPGFSVISGFFVRALLWLVPCLALWYAGRHYVVLAPAWLAEFTMHTLFPFWVHGSELQGTQQVLLTGLGVPMPGGRVADVTPEANVLTYAYGAPLLAALFLAVRSQGSWWKIPLGWLMLLPFQAWGVCFTWLLQVGVHMAEATRSQTRFDAFDANLIGAGYQIGFLLLPTLAPILIWLALDRRLIQQVLIEGALSAGD